MMTVKVSVISGSDSVHFDSDSKPEPKTAGTPSDKPQGTIPGTKDRQFTGGKKK